MSVQISTRHDDGYALANNHYEPARDYVEITVGGIIYRTTAYSREHARQLAYNTARDLGMPVGSVIEC